MNFEDNKGLFLDEARETIGKLERGLLELEEEPGNLELVNEVFRYLHTIKGSGGMFGFERISEFAHAVESLFDDVRKGVLALDSRIIDIGLRSADFIGKLLAGEANDEEDSNIAKDMDLVRSGLPVTPTVVGDPGNPGFEDRARTYSKAPATTKGPLTSGMGKAPVLRILRISFKPQQQIFSRGVRLEPLLHELAGLGTCHILPSFEDIPPIEDMVPTACYLAWTIVLSTSVPLEEIKAVFIFVEDYADIEYRAFESEEGIPESTVPRIGQILAARGHIAEEDIEEIREEQKPFGQLAVEAGKLKPESLAGALAEQAAFRAIHSEHEARQETSTVRVQKDKLDDLVDLAGELVILQAILGQEAKKAGSQVFGSIAENLSRLSADLRDTAMSIRMVPLGESFGAFRRLIRDIAHQIGKDIRLEISGGETELDKNVIELLKDPIVHIIRNSADHGIEVPEVRVAAGKPRTGLVSIDARQVGSRVEITIRDDGAGLDLAKIKAKAVQRRLLSAAETDTQRIMSMIFEPGLSTVEKANGLSGRGVGMDVVKRNIERLRGEVRVESIRGNGTTIVLSIPLTLVIVDSLLVSVAGVEYVIALGLVDECIDEVDGAFFSPDSKVIRLRDRTIPVIDLVGFFGDRQKDEDLSAEGRMDRRAEEGNKRLVIVSVEGAQFAIRVDEIVGKQQVVIKPFSASIKGIDSISGATILGDGSVALIVNVANLAASYYSDSRAS